MISEGRIVGITDRADVDIVRLGLLMAGHGCRRMTVSATMAPPRAAWRSTLAFRVVLSIVAR